MKWLLLLSLLALALIVVITVTKVKILIYFYHGKDNDFINMEVRAWGGLIRYKKEIPMIAVDDDSPSLVFEEEAGLGPDEEPAETQEKQLEQDEVIKGFHDLKALLEHIVGMHVLVRQFLRKVTIKKLEWHTVIGIGDAASTAVLSGTVWAMKGGIIGLLSRYMRLAELPVVTVTPNFQQFMSQIQLKCIFQIRIGNAIWAGIKLIKYWRGGRPSFKTKPLSVLSSD
ncbi:DUF2953 domain-containing protein [Mesobacillus foraminis]|uniref:DUF2953 domain-containing protein n=1 Tax=Mesobacillus foraminis TaxID=279826 RepID=UPI0039A1A409